MSSEITAKDFVLLLYLDNQKPIKGNLFFQKEMFLIVEEVYPELRKELGFYPHNHGPYSDNLVNILNNLKDNNFIDYDSEGNEYSITKEGIKYIESIKFPEDIANKVKNLKVGSNRLGYKGLLRYVYFNYPRYTPNSKIKELLGG